jgi:hypothetical protein
VIKLYDDAALIDDAKPIANELRANLVRFSKATIQDADHTMLVIGARDPAPAGPPRSLSTVKTQGMKPSVEAVAEILATIR